MATGVDVARIGALSVAATSVVMILVKAGHPPAGATTLITSFGIVTTPLHLAVLEIAVALRTVQAFFINRMAGRDYPLWARRKAKGTGAPVSKPKGA